MSNSLVATEPVGRQAVGRLAPTPQFGNGVTRHHRPLLDDYTVAKLHILEAIGDISEFDVFGKQVLLAVFCSPGMSPGGIHVGEKAQKEDWYQNKAGLILKMGPDAFNWDKSMIGGMRKPEPGDWMFSNASAGIGLSVWGTGGKRPQGVDHRGDSYDIYEWDGWPCRIIADSNFLGRVATPNQVV